MKILFGTEYYGKDISECPTHFICWIIDGYEGADWLLRQAAKQELATRFKVDWTPYKMTEEEFDKLEASQAKRINDMKDKISLLEKCLIMSTCFGATRIEVDGYLQNPKLLESNLNLIKLFNS